MREKSKPNDGKRSENDLKSALYRKAVGYDSTETAEEYSESDGELVLVKRKVTIKNVPPDVSALKMLLDMNETEDLSALSDEQLEKERKKLLKILKEKKKCSSKKSNSI